jgi:hypothetical protein
MHLDFSRKNLWGPAERVSGRSCRIGSALLAICAAFVASAETSSAQEPAPADAAKSELDAQLLQDLGGDLFKPEGGADELEEGLLESLGEDIGKNSPSDDPHSPLERIGAQMRSVQRLLAEQPDAGRATLLQDRIVRDLDELIKQVQRRKNQSQSGGKSSPGSQRPDAEPQGGGQPGNTSAEGQQPAADSREGTREGAGEGSTADRDRSRSELVKNLWGHLPERVRQQMLQSPDDEFLPKYEFEIEQYFRRLAEDPELDER